jgi:hypothetical protein
MRFIIGIIVAVGLIVLLVVLLFGRGPAPAPNATKQMVSYAVTSTVVQYTDDYPVTADQTHVVVETTVGRDGNNISQRFWSTSCGNLGSFKGNASTVRELFQRQVPDYNVLTSGLSNISSIPQ